ncbi:MAG: VWA domain-containing protein [Bacillota bacterium]|nr:VWA domain-containing protein [Bacillota bacterium]
MEKGIRKGIKRRWLLGFFFFLYMMGIGFLYPVQAEGMEPEHHKYIKYNGDDSYTLTLDVKGMYDKEVDKPLVDVLLILDRSGSMNEWMGYGKTRMSVLKKIVTGENGLSKAVLENENMDAQMAVVAYSGIQDYERWNDAEVICDWTSRKSYLDSSVNEIKADGGTNCHAGLYHGAEVLENSRENAQKYVIFLSDGEPSYYYDDRGYTKGRGSEYHQTAADKAYWQAERIQGLEGFYTVAIGGASKSIFMENLAAKVPAKRTCAYRSGNADELTKVFQEIASNITEYTCRSVVIRDTLSEYAELVCEEGTSFQPIVTAIQDNGQPAEIPEILAQYQSSAREIIVEFPKDYVLPSDVTYMVSFEIKPSQKAYETYIKSGYLHVGSEGSDAPGNDTSAQKPGFYSNAQAKLEYVYGKEDATSATAEYREKPVVQIQTEKLNASLTVEKRVEGKMGDKTKEFEFLLTLKDADQNPLMGEYSYQKINADGTMQEGELLFEDGTAYIYLRHGESITIEKLPFGGEYILEENAEDAYGYQVSYEEDAVGKLDNQKEKIVVINTRNQVPPTGIQDTCGSFFLLLFLTFLSGIGGCLTYLRRKGKRK